MKYIYFQWIRLLKNKIAAELRISTSEFTTNGTIYRFKKDGTFIEKFDAGGINPNSAVFFN